MGRGGAWRVVQVEACLNWRSQVERRGVAGTCTEEGGLKWRGVALALEAEEGCFSKLSGEALALEECCSGEAWHLHWRSVVVERCGTCTGGVL